MPLHPYTTREAWQKLKMTQVMLSKVVNKFQQRALNALRVNLASRELILYIIRR